MNKIVCYKSTDNDGNVVVPIVFPFDGARRQVVVTPASLVIQDGEIVAIPAETRDETDAELIAWVAAKDVPAGVAFKIVDASSVPPDEDLPTWFDGLGKPDGKGMGHDAWEAAEIARIDGITQRLQAQYDELAAQVAGKAIVESA